MRNKKVNRKGNRDMRLLKKRFGEITVAITSQVENLSLADLESLTEEILDFQSLQDLESWLEDR